MAQRLGHGDTDTGVNSDQGVSVLVADHNRWSRQGIATMLAEAGLSVYEASNGFSALRIALDVGPQLVLIAAELPEMGADELVSRLRSDPATRHAAIVGGHDVVEADASLPLPCDPVALLATVLIALETRRQALAAAPIRSVITSPRGTAPFVEGTSRATSSTRNGGRSGKLRFRSDIETL